ncbi:MAG: PH domain-containing protein [Planctomycetales bacterium]|nr:PH domain-containing protein [Planctomycetales bacterium]
MNKQAIPGVAPAAKGEVTIMTVWPTLAALAYGRWWGQLFMSNAGPKILGIPVTFGRIMALVSIPFILPIYGLTLIPRIPFVIFGVKNPWCVRYRLTNRRVLVEPGLGGEATRSVTLDRFDAVEVDVRPGQAWYPAGDLVFKLGATETFRLEGVPRPETFRQTCLKACQSHAGVAHAREIGCAV